MICDWTMMVMGSHCAVMTCTTRMMSAAPMKLGTVRSDSSARGKRRAMPNRNSAAKPLAVTSKMCGYGGSK